MSSPTSTEIKVVRIDADATPAEVSKTLTLATSGGWKLVTSYHLHHLNSIDFVFSSEFGSPTK
jgi:hypothetical protein